MSLLILGPPSEMAFTSLAPRSLGEVLRVLCCVICETFPDFPSFVTPCKISCNSPFSLLSQFHVHISYTYISVPYLYICYFLRLYLIYFCIV